MRNIIITLISISLAFYSCKIKIRLSHTHTKLPRDMQNTIMKDITMSTNPEKNTMSTTTKDIITKDTIMKDMITGVKQNKKQFQPPNTATKLSLQKHKRLKQTLK